MLKERDLGYYILRYGNSLNYCITMKTANVMVI